MKKWETLETLYVYASWKKIKCVCLYSTNTAFTQHKHDKCSLPVNKRSKASPYRDFQKGCETLSIPQQINDTHDCNKTSIGSKSWCQSRHALYCENGCIVVEKLTTLPLHSKRTTSGNSITSMTSFSGYIILQSTHQAKHQVHIKNYMYVLVSDKNYLK